MANQLAKIEVAPVTLPGWAPDPAKVKAYWGDGDWVGSSAPGNVFSSGWRGYDTSPGTAVNYASLAGPLWANSAVQAVLNWIIRAWPESYPCVKMKGRDVGKKLIVPHALTDILLDPNEWDDDTTLWAGTIISFWCDGNAYWRIVRDRGGRVREFEYIHHWAISPIREVDSRTPGPDYYTMNTNRGPVDLDPHDVVHFRFGRDPQHDLYGLSQWASADREVYTDNEGCNYTATTIRNRGTAWMVVSPSSSDGEIDDPTAVRDLIEARTTGDNRGRVVVLTGAIKVDHPGPMKDMGMEGLRQIPVHRICALAGIAVDSLDLGDAGDHVTFQNQKAADAKSWNTLVSVQRMLGRQLTKQVLWHPRNFNVPRNSLWAGFDYSEVRALQDQKAERWKAAVEVVKAGLLTPDEGRGEIGYDALTPVQRQEIEDHARSLLPEPPPPPPKPAPVVAAAGNGTGKAVGDVGKMLREQLAVTFPA